MTRSPLTNRECSSQVTCVAARSQRTVCGLRGSSGELQSGGTGETHDVLQSLALVRLDQVLGLPANNVAQRGRRQARRQQAGGELHGGSGELSVRRSYKQPVDRDRRQRRRQQLAPGGGEAGSAQAPRTLCTASCSTLAGTPQARPHDPRWDAAMARGSPSSHHTTAAVRSGASASSKRPEITVGGPWRSRQSRADSETIGQWAGVDAAAAAREGRHRRSGTPSAPQAAAINLPSGWWNTTLQGRAARCGASHCEVACSQIQPKFGAGKARGGGSRWARRSDPQLEASLSLEAAADQCPSWCGATPAPSRVRLPRHRRASADGRETSP